MEIKKNKANWLSCYANLFTTVTDYLKEINNYNCLGAFTSILSNTNHLIKCQKYKPLAVSVQRICQSRVDLILSTHSDVIDIACSVCNVKRTAMKTRKDLLWATQFYQQLIIRGFWVNFQLIRRVVIVSLCVVPTATSRFSFPLTIDLHTIQIWNVKFFFHSA